MGALPASDGWRAASPIRKPESGIEVVPAISEKPGPRRFTRIPTHAIGVAAERRRYPRAVLSLPLRLTRIGDAVEQISVMLVTRNISSSGIYFLAPRDLEPGTAIELEVALVERPMGFGSVRMRTAAHIVRAEETEIPGWRAYAASFDDFALQRDDRIPRRYSARADD